jgi:hypothetical protein
MSRKEELVAILKTSSSVWAMLERCPSFGIKNYYLGAGVISQTVWNAQNHNDLLFGISDVDFVYFDPDLSYEKEDGYIHRIQKEFQAFPLGIDVKNEARVHLWYKSHFGYDIAPYRSVEEAIASWPTTATAVGIRLENGKPIVYAPFGLEDLFRQIIRPNKTAVKEEVYRAKCEKWKAKWPSLTILPW